MEHGFLNSSSWFPPSELFIPLQNEKSIVRYIIKHKTDYEIDTWLWLCYVYPGSLRTGRGSSSGEGIGRAVCSIPPDQNKQLALFCYYHFYPDRMLDSCVVPIWLFLVWNYSAWCMIELLGPICSGAIEWILYY